MNLPTIFFDAPFLRGFAGADMLSLCEYHCATNRLEPHWNQGVYDDLHAAAAAGDECSRSVLADAAWLGEPLAPVEADRERIFAMHIALSDGRPGAGRCDGDAELVHMVDWYKATLATDSSVLFDMARRRFGEDRVVDTVAVLQGAITMRFIGKAKAARVIESIVDNGGRLRRGDGRTVVARYFTGEPQ